MAKKKGGKKKKGAKDAKEVIVVETTKEMERERALVKTGGLPLGARYSIKRRADAIRAEVAAARLKSCMIKKTSRLSLRGLALENVPAEFGWGKPPFEGMWRGLEVLDLSNNDLFKTDEVFAALKTLGDHIKRLDLSGNALVGEVPSSAGAFVRLEELAASDNQFTGIAEDAAACWTRLTSLTMNRNKLASLPLAANAWSELIFLDLRQNQLAVLEDQSCATWTKLETCKVGGNKLASLPAGALHQWGSLKALYATDNRISDLPLSLRSCRLLEVLHLGVNQIKDLPSELFGTPPIDDLGGAPAATAPAAATSAVPATPESGDAATVAVLAPLFSGCFGRLRELELYRNKVASVPDDFGCGLPALEQLSLSGNALKALPSPGLGAMVGLVELHLANNGKLGRVPDDLTGLVKLKYVNLAGCASVKALPPALAAAWTELREIDIRSGAKKEKCKLTLDWTDASLERGFLIRGGIPPKKGKKGKK